MCCVVLLLVVSADSNLSTVLDQARWVYELLQCVTLLEQHTLFAGTPSHQEEELYHSLCGMDEVDTGKVANRQWVDQQEKINKCEA